MPRPAPKLSADRMRLATQLYGIAMAQTVFGGPKGVWLECRDCPQSHRIAGATAEQIEDATDAEIAAVFRHHGWTGVGDRMTQARCPQCSAAG